MHGSACAPTTGRRRDRRCERSFRHDGGGVVDATEALERLADLRDRGMLTQAEFVLKQLPGAWFWFPTMHVFSRVQDNDRS